MNFNGQLKFQLNKTTNALGAKLFTLYYRDKDKPNICTSLTVSIMNYFQNNYVKILIEGKFLNLSLFYGFRQMCEYLLLVQHINPCKFRFRAFFFTFKCICTLYTRLPNLTFCCSEEKKKFKITAYNHVKVCYILRLQSLNMINTYTQFVYRMSIYRRKQSTRTHNSLALLFQIRLCDLW